MLTQLVSNVKLKFNVNWIHLHSHGESSGSEMVKRTKGVFSTGLDPL